MKRWGAVAYRLAVIGLLGYCALKLNDLDRHTPSTYILEQQLRELITTLRNPAR